MEPRHPFMEISVRNADLTEDQLPSCETLMDTIARAPPFWTDETVPKTKGGKDPDCVPCQHLRGIIKDVESLSVEDVMELNLPTGLPVVYRLNRNLKLNKPLQFLRDRLYVKPSKLRLLRTR